jgi:hypothetical protein
MSLDTLPFETLSKTVYSHGLEAIYALETVDIRTVKKMEVFKKNPVVKKPLLISFEEEFPFEFRFRKTLPSTFLSLPIDYLELSKPLILRLKEKRIFLVSDLRGEKEALLKGSFQQNDKEELKKLFEKIFKGKSLDFSSTIDWLSFLKQALFPIDKRGAHLLLQEFQIDHLIELPLSLKLSVKTISSSLRKELIDQAKTHLKTISLKPFLDVFVIPWMRGRGSLATKQEILQRLSLVSEEMSFSSQIPLFFEKVGAPLELIPFEEELFTVDLLAKEKISRIEQVAKTYFYNPSLVYSLETLVNFILKELASQFIFATHDEVATCLKYLKTFRVRRNRDQLLICHLA